MTTKRTVLLVMLSCLAGFARAETGAKLRGRVVDQTGSSVAGAVALLASRDGLQLIGVSDAAGAFEFIGLTPGDYLLSVSAAGFKRHVADLRLASGDDKTIAVALRVAGVDEQLLVTASGTPQLPDEVSKSASLVDKKDLERRQEFSFVEALRPVPGLRIVQLGGPGSFSKILVRGLRVIDTSLLVDGVRVRDAADFRGGINPVLGDLFLNNVERIEILRGSGSSLYGSNAVGGVINLVSEEGAGSPAFEVALEAGGLGLFREQAKVSGGLRSSFGYSVSASRLDLNEGVHGDEVYRNASAGTRLRYIAKPGISLRGTVTFSDGFNRLTDSPFPVGPPGNEFGFATGAGPVVGFVENDVNPDSFRDARFAAAAASLSHQAAGGWSYSLSFQSVLTSRRFSNGPDQSSTSKKFGLFEFTSESLTEGRTDTFSVTNTIRAGGHNLITAGLEAEREALTQEFTSAFFSSPLTTDRQRSLAFFVQDQVSLVDGRLQISGAFRTQSFALKNPESVPEVRNIDIKRAIVGDGSVAFLVQRSGTKLRAHAGNSFRAPSLSERFSLFRGVRIGNPFLRPERGLSADLGIDQQLLNGKLQASATYFYSRLQEVITSTSLLNTTNARGGLSRGFEASVAGSLLGGLDFNCAYTYTNSSQVLSRATLRSDNVGLVAGVSVPAFSVPRHSLGVGINQRLGRGLNLNLDLYAASEHLFPLFDPVFFSQVLTRFAGYTKADLGASYLWNVSERTKVSIYGRVDNLFDQRIVEEGFLAPGTTAGAGFRVRF